MTFKTLLAAGALSLALGGTAGAGTIVFSASADYSGPFADVMPDAMAGLRATIDWWNREVGADLGVDVDLRIYDMRYDPAVIARTSPAILSSDAPVMHLGFGSPDLTTLMGRLPQDRVPMLIGTAMVGLVWRPGAGTSRCGPPTAMNSPACSRIFRSRRGMCCASPPSRPRTRPGSSIR